MGYVKKKIGAYFIMHDENPTRESFLKMDHEISKAGFNSDNFQKVMILTPKQMSYFLNDICMYHASIPNHDNFQKWEFAGFMIRTLHGHIL